MAEMTVKDFYAFMNRQSLGVISTVDANGNPEAAVVGFGQTEKLELVFGTDNTTRKYANLQSNTRVAFVIGWSDEGTIQYEGVVRELRDDELDIVRNSYWKKTPRAEKFGTETNRYFIVTPTWIRFTALNTKPWTISELRF